MYVCVCVGGWGEGEGAEWSCNIMLLNGERVGWKVFSLGSMPEVVLELAASLPAIHSTLL